VPWLVRLESLLAALAPLLRSAVQEVHQQPEPSRAPLLEEKEVDLEVDWESDFEPDSSAALVALELVAQRLLCWLVCDVFLAQMTKLIHAH